MHEFVVDVIMHLVCCFVLLVVFVLFCWTCWCVYS